jgi:hypothetical protein
MKKKPQAKSPEWTSLETLEFKNLGKGQRKRKIRYHASKLQELGIPVNIKKRTFQISCRSIDDLPGPQRFYLRKLLRLGFTTQFSLI